MTKNDTQRKQVLTQIISRSFHLRANLPAVKLSGGAHLKVVINKIAEGEKKRVLIYREGQPGASYAEAQIVARDLKKVLQAEFPSAVFETAIVGPINGQAKGVDVRGYSVTFEQIYTKEELELIKADESSV